jgi:hypothetical protein
MKVEEVNEKASVLFVLKGLKQGSIESAFEFQLCQFLQCNLRGDT